MKLIKNLEKNKDVELALGLEYLREASSFKVISCSASSAEDFLN